MLVSSHFQKLWQEASNLSNVWIHHNKCNHGISVQRAKDIVISDNSVVGQVVGNGLYNATFANNVVVQPAAVKQYTESGLSPLIALGFVSDASIRNNTLVSAGSWADFGAAAPTVLPVGVSVWGSIWDRFRGTAAADSGAYYHASTGVSIVGNRFVGEYSGPN
jgi:hypothetical protein